MALAISLVCGVEQFPIKASPVRFSHSPTSSFQFLYSPYPSPGALQSPSKYVTGCSLIGCSLGAHWVLIAGRGNQ
jgi:hypothetical protein